MTPIGFGIVGCGVIGPFHAEALSRIPEARLVAVCDAVPERARSLADRFGCDWVESYEALLARADLEVVCICTPSGLHAAMGIAAAQAGKHVVVEKPLALRTVDADRLITACEAAGVALGGILQYRFTDAAQRVKEAVESGRLGRIFLASADVKWYRPPAYYETEWRGTWTLDGGVLANQGPHHLDLLLWLLGEPAEILFARLDTVAHRIEAADAAWVVIRFHSGAVATVQATTAAYPGLPARLEVCGERGAAVIVGDQLEFLETGDGSPKVRPPLADETDPAEPIDEGLLTAASDPAALPSRWHEVQLRDFVAAVREGRPPAVDGQEARRVVALLEAIHRKAGISKLSRSSHSG